MDTRQRSDACTIREKSEYQRQEHDLLLHPVYYRQKKVGLAPVGVNVNAAGNVPYKLDSENALRGYGVLHSNCSKYEEHAIGCSYGWHFEKSREDADGNDAHWQTPMENAMVLENVASDLRPIYSQRRRECRNESESTSCRGPLGGPSFTGQTSYNYGRNTKLEWQNESFMQSKAFRGASLR